MLILPISYWQHITIIHIVKFLFQTECLTEVLKNGLWVVCHYALLKSSISQLACEKAGVLKWSG